MIAVDHLTKRYGTVAAVDGLGFEVGSRTVWPSRGERWC